MTSEDHVRRRGIARRDPVSMCRPRSGRAVSKSAVPTSSKATIPLARAAQPARADRKIRGDGGEWLRQVHPPVKAMAECSYSLRGRYFRIGKYTNKHTTKWLGVCWVALSLRHASLAELSPCGLACLSLTSGMASIATRLPSVQLWDLVQQMLSKAQQLVPLGRAVLAMLA